MEQGVVRIHLIYATQSHNESAQAEVSSAGKALCDSIAIADDISAQKTEQGVEERPR